MGSSSVFTYHRQGSAVLWSACLSVCLFVFFCFSARIPQKPQVQISPNSPYVLPVPSARSPFNGNAICYVLPVLRKMLYFHIIDRIWQNQRRRDCFCRVCNVAAPGVKSDVAAFNLFSSLMGRDAVSRLYSYRS